MIELVQRIVNNLNSQIQELELIDKENRFFLSEATKNKNVPESEVISRMEIAKKQQGELIMLIAWKKYYETTYLGLK